MHIVSGHQPSYLPWLGFFHKAMLCDTYIYMDDVQYLTGDWNNRNQIKTSSSKPLWLTVPVDLKNSKSQILKDILVKDESNLPEKKRWSSIHNSSLQASYGKSNHYKTYKEFFEYLYMDKKWEYLADLNHTILKQAFVWFGINCEVRIASGCGFTKAKSDLVLEHGTRFGADVVVTGTFGKDYIIEEDFRKNGIKVYYQEYKHSQYPQRFEGFVPYMSFVDLLFNVGAEVGREIILSGNVTREELCKSLS
jgi:hypothetical protein